MRLTIDEVAAAQESGCALVDIRKSTSFGAAFLHGSINIGLTPNSANWLHMVCEPDKEIVLIGDYEPEITAAIEQFRSAGFERIRGFLDGGVQAWASSGKDLDHLPQLTARSVRRVLGKYGDHTLLDVRTDDERALSHSDDSRHVPIGRLLGNDGLRNLEDLDRERHITTMCGSGYRANIAGSFLKSQGYDNVYSMLGGMSAWLATMD